MHIENEKQLLILIKYSLPILVLFLSITITTFLYFQNQAEFEEIKKNTEIKLILDNKKMIKEQIDNLYRYIITEQKQTELNLKQQLKEKVYQAYEISMTIYKQYKNTNTKEEISLMIKSALRSIKFNNKRGYYFIYDHKGKNILYSLLPQVEGQNFMQHQDSKGAYVLKEIINALKSQEEFYHEYYWRKSKVSSEEYKKISFLKNFNEFNWFIGAGEYVDQYTEDIKERVIIQIDKFRFGENGYFIITDKNNNYLSHRNKDLIGQDGLKRLKKINTAQTILKIEQIINKEKGYLYLDFYKKNSKETTSKVMYLKKIPHWDWILSTGFYIEDIQKLINAKNDFLITRYNKNLKNALIISITVTILLLLLSLYISNIVKNRFQKYKNENKKQHDLLSQKTKLVAMGEMIENIAHQWRQPLSVVSTAATGIKIHKELNSLSDELLYKSIDIINSSAQHLSSTIDDFRDFFKPNQVMSQFNLNNVVDETMKLFNSELKSHHIIIIKNIEKIEITGYKIELIQVILNIFNNAKDAMENLESEKYIFINIYKHHNHAIIKIKDNGEGIQENTKKRIFEPYFTTKHKAQGTGIGLYMSQEIINRHMKGTLETDNVSYQYKDHNYQGACFKISIPLNFQ